MITFWKANEGWNPWCVLNSVNIQFGCGVVFRHKSSVFEISVEVVLQESKIQ